MNEVFNVQLFAEVFITLFVIMDPPGTVPIFLALTSSFSAKQRNQAARTAVLVAFGVIVVFAIFGQGLLNYMGISFDALRASGGLLLLLVAMELLTGKMEDPEPSSPKGGVNVALVPLGTPLLAGPGAIVATMVFVQGIGHGSGNEDVSRLAALISIGAGVVAVHLCLYLSMRFANVIKRVLGESGTTLVTRIAGLLLAAIAVQMMVVAVTAIVETTVGS